MDLYLAVQLESGRYSTQLDLNALGQCALTPKVWGMHLVTLTHLYVLFLSAAGDVCTGI